MFIKKSHIFAAGLMMASLISSCGKSSMSHSDGIKAIDPKNMDTTISAGDDFFKYANGAWMKSNPIPDEYSRWGAFNILQEDNNKNLRSIMEDAAKNPGSKGSNKQKIGDMFAAGMDSAAIEKNGLAPIKAELDKIAAIKSTDELAAVIADLHKKGVNPLFGVYSGQDEKNSEMVIFQLAQGGLGMGNRDYYTEQDARSKELRLKYVEFIGKLFELADKNPTTAKSNSEAIMALETKLANTSMTMLEQRDPQKTYNKVDIAKLQKMCPAFNWNAYFNGIGLANPGDINVTSVKFFSGISKIIKETPIEVWKEYLKFNVLNVMADYLPNDYVNLNFDFYGKTFSGSKKIKDRWKRVLETTNSALGEAVGQVYVEKFFPAEAKKKMLVLVENLRKALDERIQNLAWMSAETKVKAKEKLAKMKVKIGYPDKWRDYSGLDVDKSKGFAALVMASNEFEFKYMMSKVGKPVDRGEWHMTPQTVNAYYSPNMNEIVFPAAILQPPFFFKDGDDAVNYGGIGAVIGHEMTHGFDDQGRQYDANGNLNDWWTKEDAENFKKQTQPLVDQFNKFVELDSLYVNGELTLGENIADIGGITVAHVALQKALKESKFNEKIDGFTQDQRFLLSWAQVWRSNIRPEELKRRLKDDVHSPADARVNGVMPNFTPFYQAFDVKPNNKLFRPEAERVVIW